LKKKKKKKGDRGLEQTQGFQSCSEHGGGQIQVNFVTPLFSIKMPPRSSDPYYMQTSCASHCTPEVRYI
jgi:hypothetical protein